MAKARGRKPEDGQEQGSGAGGESGGEARPLRLEYRTAAELADNPQNWRRHPVAQLRALKAAKDTVGWAGAALFNERTGRLVDGHARKLLAGPDERIPVLIGSWSEAEERMILATLDPLGTLARIDRPALQDLVSETHTTSATLQGLLDKIAPPIIEPKVQEVSTSRVFDRFWIAVRGPLEHQALMLQKLTELAKSLDGVEIELGTIPLEGL